jgi:hypothetical protein
MLVRPRNRAPTPATNRGLPDTVQGIIAVSPPVPDLPIHAAVEVRMRVRVLFTVFGVGLATFTLVAAGAQSDQGTQKPQVQIPKPGVPQIMTLEDEFVRVAYNNEGYVSLGYRLANTQVGKEWIFIEAGFTLREGRPLFKLTRSALSLSTPDGKTLPLPSNADYLKVDLRALENQSKVVFDSINYFPPTVRSVNRVGFFSDNESRTRSYDEVELSPQYASVGRLYFQIPGGLQYGQYFLNVQFKESVVRVPFRILTAEEQKILAKNWKDIRKQVQEAFKKGGK